MISRDIVSCKVHQTNTHKPTRSKIKYTKRKLKINEKGASRSSFSKLRANLQKILWILQLSTKNRSSALECTLSFTIFAVYRVKRNNYSQQPHVLCFMLHAHDLPHVHAWSCKELRNSLSERQRELNTSNVSHYHIATWQHRKTAFAVAYLFFFSCRLK